MRQSRRLTLVLTQNEATKRAWEIALPGHSVIVLREMDLLREIMLSEGVRSRGEIARVVLDGGLEPIDFLKFLASLPVQFRGDVLLTGPDGSFLSSADARGDGRVLYALERDDFAFYMHINFDDVTRCEQRCHVAA